MKTPNGDFIPVNERLKNHKSIEPEDMFQEIEKELNEEVEQIKDEKKQKGL